MVTLVLSGVFDLFFELRPRSLTAETFICSMRTILNPVTQLEEFNTGPVTWTKKLIGLAAI